MYSYVKSTACNQEMKMSIISPGKTTINTIKML